MSKKKATTSDPNQLDMQQLKTKFKSQLHTLRQLFSENSWNDDDLIAVLQEVNGDLDTAIGRISEGHAQQWTTTESKKTKKQSKPAAVRGQSTRGGRGVSRGGARVGRGGRNTDAPVSHKGSWAEDARSTAATTGSQNSDAAKDAGWSKTQSSWSDAKPAAVVSGGWGETQSNAATAGTSWSNDKNWEKSPVAPAVVKEEASWEQPKTSGWGQTAPQASASWSSQPAAAASQKSLKPKKVPATSKSTWAQIAKPEAPVAAPLVEARQRSVSPKRAAPIEPAVTNKLHHPEAVVPPGMPIGVAAKQLINSGTSPTLNVKFGSMGLHDEQSEEQQQPEYQVPDQYAQYQSQPPPSFGADQWGVPTAGAANNVYHHPHSQQQQPQNGNASYNSGMSPANLANMYAAYFPYYMQQFPGGVPPAQQFSQQQQQQQFGNGGAYKPQGQYNNNNYAQKQNYYQQQQQQQQSYDPQQPKQQQQYPSGGGRQQRRPPPSSQQQKGYSNYFGGEQQ